MITNRQLHERYRRILPSWLALYYDEPISLDRGEGRHVWDVEGNRYLDFFGGILTTMTGYAVPEIVSAVQERFHSGSVRLGLEKSRKSHGVVGYLGFGAIEPFWQHPVDPVMRSVGMCLDP